jgi:hypothetical protein
VSDIRRVDSPEGSGPAFWVLAYSRDKIANGEAVPHEFVVSGERCAEVREAEPGENHRWTGEHGLLGAEIGRVRVTQWWALGVQGVGIWRENGEFLGQATFTGAGHGPSGNIVEPGVVAIIRLPGATNDSILVGNGDEVWVVDPVPMDAPRLSPEERALLESIPRRPK